MTQSCHLASDDNSIECASNRSFERLLMVPLGIFNNTVVAEITIGVDPKYGETLDSDFWVLLCDSNTGIGFQVVDVKNYKTLEPCFHVQGTTGETLTNRQVMHLGPLVNASNPYPQEYNFLISTYQQSGACTTATAMEGRYTTAGNYATFKNKLTFNLPLSLEIYADNKGEKYNFKYFAINIEEEM